MSRQGFGPPPRGDDHFVDIQHLIGQFVGWNKYMRVVNPERCPQDHAAVFYGNHIKLDDPFYLFRAAYLATDGRVTLRAMQRSDFFKSRLFNNRFFDMNEFMACLGTYSIDRDSPTLSQLKFFVGLLEKGDSFILFPGRTRTCSGVLMDYRGPFQEPGGISFFLHQLQRKHPEEKVSAVPCYRNYNPRTKHTCCVFGDEQFLKPGASRDEQRAFDAHLVEAMAPYVTVNAVQLVAVYLFLHTVHAGLDPIGMDEIAEAITACVDESLHPYWDEEDAADWNAAVRGAVKFFDESDCVILGREDFVLDREAILFLPELTSKFRKINPVRFHANEILHLAPVIERVESEVLKRLT